MQKGREQTTVGYTVMYRLICQKPAHFFVCQNGFGEHLFFKLEMYNFQMDPNSMSTIRIALIARDEKKEQKIIYFLTYEIEGGRIILDTRQIGFIR